MTVTIDGTNGVTASASFYGQSTFTGTYTDGIVVDYTTGTGRITVGAADGLKIRNGGTASPTDLVTVDSSGNVGIGTSSPSQKLHVSGGLLQVTRNTQNMFLNPDYNSGGTTGALVVDTGKVLAFMQADTERARIDSGGNLLVGTTSVLGNASNTTIGVQISPSFTWVATQDAAYFQRLVSDGTVQRFLRGATQVGSISVTGSATSYVTSSDYRLKENIAPMTGALSVVQQLKPCTYTWKADGSDGQGFIAHELQAVVPDCVTGEKDAVDADGNPVYQGIDTSFLVATLTAAIKEQQAIIQQLQADVAALKAAT